MTERQQREAAKAFAHRWSGVYKEQQFDQSYWNDMLTRVFGIKDATTLYTPQYLVNKKSRKRIDLYFPKTRVIIEHKSSDIDLDAPEMRSGKPVTPFEQAKDYDNELRRSLKANWIVVCNFHEIRVHNMDGEDPAKYDQILLKDFEQEFHRLKFLIETGEDVGKKEKSLSVETGTLTNEIYNELFKQYGSPKEGKLLNDLNQLCMRLVFCMFAEDAGMFNKKQFCNYLNARKSSPSDFTGALKDLFEVLNQPYDKRKTLLAEDLKAFPYVNGGLFADDIEIPQFNNKLIRLILEKACLFDWNKLTPTIFGNVFESTLNPETRAAGGMHYTSVENIHKVIDPLFLNDLREELDRIKTEITPKMRNYRLREFQKKLGSLTFLDPACGSGNFLTETYMSLRRLENEAIAERYKFNPKFLSEEVAPVCVKISQFYGIEINDFAVSVAKTALWIAEYQMLNEMEKQIGEYVGTTLPLIDITRNIHEGNALTIDWSTVVKARNLSYIIGNPPFTGAKKTTTEQRKELENVFGAECRKAKSLDYVSGWYKKCADFIERKTKVALVSTNSICQGEQVAPLWNTLLKKEVHIDFAFRTFKWESDAKKLAHVHCVIIGFSKTKGKTKKYIYNDQALPVEAERINPYLFDGENILVESKGKSLCGMPKMGIGNKPIDDGNYIFTKEEKDAFLMKEPEAEKYLHEYYGAEEFISQSPRYILWLGNCSQEEIAAMPYVAKRVEAVRKFRLSRESEETKELAKHPTHYHVENMPESAFLLVPRTSSENRDYIPIGFMTSDKFTSDGVQIIPNATLFHFGVLTSSVHMAWMKIIGGKLKSDYRYSNEIVYNNFPWPKASAEQEQQISTTAQAILDARNLYPNKSLADLYDKEKMPEELRKAHHDNDLAVLSLFGYDEKMSEEEIVKDLLLRYKQLITPKKKRKKRKNRKGRK